MSNGIEFMKMTPSRQSSPSSVREFSPDASDSDFAREWKKELSRYISPDMDMSKFDMRAIDRTVEFKFVDVKKSNSTKIPANAFSLLLYIFETMAEGHGVTVIPENCELTTVQAAKILNVSRPFLIRLLELGKIPYRKVGNHRRISSDALLSYKKSVEQREAVLDELASESQKLGLYDMHYDSDKP